MAGLNWKITADDTDFEQKLRNARQNLRDGARDAENVGGQLNKVFDKAAQSIAAFATIDLGKNIVKSIIETTGQFQQLQVAFETMLGSGEKANELMAQLVKTAATTPFDLKGVAEGAKQLLAYGIQAQDVNKTIVDLGNIASGLSIPLNDLVYLYGTTVTQGRMFTMDLRQFMGRGIPIADELAKQFGVAKDKVAGLVSAGKVTSKEFIKAIQAMSEEGGRFANLMDKQSQTITGQISNIGDSVSMMFNNIGKNSEGVINDSLYLVSQLVANYQSVGKALIEIAAVYGTYKAAMIAVNAVVALGSISEAAHYASIVATERAQKLLNTTMLSNPYALVTAAVVGLGYAVYKVSTYNDVFSEANKRVKDANDKVSESTETEMNKLDSLNNQLQQNKKGTEKWKEAKDLVIKQYGQYDSKLSQEINKTGDLTISYNKLATAIRKAMAARQMKTFYDDNESKTQDDIQKMRTIVYNDLSLNYGKKYANQHMNEINKYVNTGHGLSPSLSNAIKNMNKSTNPGFLQKMLGINYDAGAGNVGTKAVYEMRNTRIAGNHALNDYMSMNGIDKTTGLKMIFGGDTSSTENAPAGKQDFEYWDKKKKDLEGDLKSLTDIEAKGRKGLELRKKIAAIDKKMEAYSPSKMASSSKAALAAENKAKVASEKANEKLAKSLDEQTKANEESLKISNDETDQMFDLRQKTVDNMEDGITKQQHQIKLDYDKSNEELKRKKASVIKELQQQVNDKFESDNPDWRKNNPRRIGRKIVTYDDVPDRMQTNFNDYDVDNETIRSKATSDLWKTVEKKYQSPASKISDVHNKYDKERSQLKEAYFGGKTNIKTEDEYSGIWNESFKKEAEEVKQINEQLYSEIQKDGGALSQLFEDTSTKSVGEIQKIIDRTQVLLQYIRGVKDENGNSTITDSKGKKTVVTANKLNQNGFTVSDANVIGSDPTRLKNVTDQVLKLDSIAHANNPFKALSDSIKSFSTGTDNAGNKIPTFEGKMKKLGEASSSVADMIGGITSNLATMFSEAGNTEMADMASGVGDVMTSVSNIGKGFAQGGIVGGIASAAGEAISWAGKAFSAESRHKEALKKIQQDILAQQRAYNLELEKTNLEYKKGTTIFGTDKYSKAINAVSVMKDAYSNLGKELKNINDIEIITGHHKTGLFGTGKGADDYTDVLKVYPELISANGEFNTTLAKTILSTRRMSDEDKTAMQSMIDYAAEAEDAWQSVQDYFTDIFGDLGNSITSALKTAFENGTDYGYQMCDSISNMIESLAENMIYSNLFSGMFKQANDKFLEITKNTGLSSTQQSNAYMQVMSGLMSQIKQTAPEAQALTEQWKELASNYGFDIFDKQKSSNSSNTATSVTADQDSVNMLEGKATAIEMIEEQSRDYLLLVKDTLLSISTNNITMLQKIEETRGLVFTCASHLEGIKKNTDFLGLMDAKLKNIEENTKGLTSR